MFKIQKNDGKARIGTLTIRGIELETPVFMPCGTKGTIKSLKNDDIKALEYDLFLCNTYHLMLRPGENFIAEKGGLHKWIAWDRLLLTDSGGFQVFSLGAHNKITENGVEFSSYLNGDKRFLMPEDAIQIQHKLGADIIMAFDECAPGDSTHAYARKAMKRTHNWVERCIIEHNRLSKDKENPPLLFPIAQGVIYEDLRIESTKFMASLPLPGLAIGGLSVGESKEDMYSTLEAISPYFPEEKPRYLMGVGSPEDIVEAVYHGIDMFDCVLPTRLARHGTFWDFDGRHHLRNARYRNQDAPLVPGCDCYACQNHSANYIFHLCQEKEILGPHLLTIHNLRFLKNLTTEIKRAIREGRYEKFREEFKKRFVKEDSE
jgi:queuine tRNA-ribosyltransferase